MSSVKLARCSSPRDTGGDPDATRGENTVKGFTGVPFLGSKVFRF
jgi:hypothetical protein